MLRFVGILLKTATDAALRSMGTTALAVGVGIVAGVVSVIEDLRTEGIRAALASGGGHALLVSLVAWLILLMYHAARSFRPLLREHRRVFRLLVFDQDQHSDSDRVLIWCLLQFSRDYPGPVDLTVRVITLFPAGDPTATVVHTERLDKVIKDDRKRLLLGSLRIAKPDRPAVHSIWGSELGTVDLKPGQRPIVPGSTRNLIEISIGPQTYRCFTEFVTAPPGALSMAMYNTNEDRSPWILADAATLKWRN